MTVKGFRVHTRRFNRTLKYLKKVIQHMDEYEGITHTNISFIRCCHVIRINNHLCFHFHIFSKTNISKSMSAMEKQGLNSRVDVYFPHLVKF